jgi:hypothetical protein
VRLLFLWAAIFCFTTALPASAQQPTPLQAPAAKQESPTNQGTAGALAQLPAVTKKESQAGVGRVKRLYPEWVSALIKDADTLLRIFALGVAAVWAYFKFAKGRVFRSRLEPVVTVESIVKNTFAYLNITITVKNVGLSKVDLHQDGTGLRVFGARSGWATKPMAADWDHLGTLSTLTAHSWIEPGETVEDQILFVVPGENTIAFRAELRVSDSRTVWGATGLGLPENESGSKPEITG